MRLALVPALLLASEAASAGPATAELVYRGEHCAAADLQAKIAALTEHDPFSGPGEDLIVTVDEQGAPGHHEATVAIVDRGQARGTRVLIAESCDALHDEMALAIAMVLAAEPSREQTIEPAITDRPAETTPRLDIVGGVAASARGLPAVIVGVRVPRRWYSLGAELALHAPESKPVAQGLIHVSGGGGALIPCVHRGWLAGCGVLQVGWWRGHGQALVMAQAATSPAVALGGRIAVEGWALDWLGVRAHGELRAYLTTTRFLVDEAAVWASPRAELWLGISGVVRIP